MARFTLALAVMLIFIYGSTVEVEGLYRFVSTAKTWGDADKDCKKWGGFLANVQSAAENSYIAKAAKARKFGFTWLGYSDQKCEGKWSSTPVFTAWRKGEPNNYKNEDCASINLSYAPWNDLPCSRKINYVCKKGSVHIYVKGPKTWADAEKDCVKRGGHLACISSKAENDMVMAEVRKRKMGVEVWIGLNDIDCEGNWKCVGSYMNFMRGEPNGARRENCVMTYSGTKYPQYAGKWNDAPCNNKYQYVCQKGQGIVTRYTTKTTYKITYKKVYFKGDEDKKEDEIEEK